MSEDLILEYINTMNHTDFEDFAIFLFENFYDNSINRHPTMKNALVRDLHGDSIDYKGIYLIHSIPYDLYKNPYDIPVDSPYMVRMLEILYEEYKNQFFPNFNTFYNGRLENRLQSIYFINNFSGFPMDYYDNYLLDEYEKLIKKIGLNFDKEFITHLGSFDIFVNNVHDETLKLLTEYVNSRSVISINYSGEHLCVNQCTYDSNLSAGIGKNTKSPYYSLVSKRISEKNEIIKEFEFLLNKSPSESELEHFLVKYYKDIFGYKFDRIEPQVWLKFPDVDIANKNRRMDIFLHNSIINDWELYELKKTVPLTKTYRDIPVFTSEIYSSIQQIKNYNRILQDHSVKEKLKRDGIEYYEPTLSIVVGRTSEIPHEIWRWLVTTNKEIKILTYDNLLSEMTMRLKSHSEFLDLSNE